MGHLLQFQVTVRMYSISSMKLTEVVAKNKKNVGEILVAKNWGLTSEASYGAA
jgi:hypothetical protein